MWRYWVFSKPVWACAFCLFLVSVAANGQSRWRHTDGGIAYRIVERKAFSHPVNRGDIVLLHLIFRAGSGEVVFNTREFGNHPEEFLADPPEFNGDISEGILLLREGDSAVFRVPVDSMYRSFRPEFAEGQSFMQYEVKVLEVLTPEELSQQKQIERQRTILRDWAAIRELLGNPTDLDNRDSVLVRHHLRGTGDSVVLGKLLTVHYAGSLANGEPVDNSWERGEPFSFVPGKNQVITGWERALKGAHVGDSLTAYIPAALAYGKRGAGAAIPPDAILVFTISVQDVYDEAAQWQQDWHLIDSLFTATVTQSDTLIQAPDFAIAFIKVRDTLPLPLEGEEVILHYTLKELSGHVLYASRTSGETLRVRMSDNAEEPLQGLRQALRHIPMGATADVWLPAPQAYGAEGKPGVVPPKTPLRVTVEVLTIK